MYLLFSFICVVICNQLICNKQHIKQERKAIYLLIEKNKTLSVKNKKNGRQLLKFGTSIKWLYSSMTANSCNVSFYCFVCPVLVSFRDLEYFKPLLCVLTLAAFLCFLPKLDNSVISVGYF